MGLPLSSRPSTPPSTFEAIFRAHLGHVIRWARFFGAPRREAEDVAQLVFVALHKAVAEKRFAFDAHPGPWLRQATFRISRDHVKALRSQGDPIDAQGELDPMDDRADAERRAQVVEVRDLVLELLDGLAYDLRAVFVLHELEELTLPEIAVDLEIPVTTARARLRAARDHFEEALRRRRAADQRKHGAVTLLLPIGADALLRLARSLPQPETSPEVMSRVWARVQKNIALGAPAQPSSEPSPPPRRRLPRAFRPQELMKTGLTFAAGVVVGALGLDALHRRAPPPPHEHSPILAPASPLEDTPFPTVLPEIAADSAPASTTPAPRAATEAEATEAEAERHCLQRVSALLGTPADARAALAELERCEQRFPQTHFPTQRERLRRDAEAALSRTREHNLR